MLIVAIFHFSYTTLFLKFISTHIILKIRNRKKITFFFLIKGKPKAPSTPAFQTCKESSVRRKGRRGSNNLGVSL